MQDSRSFPSLLPQMRGNLVKKAVLGAGESIYSASRVYSVSAEHLRVLPSTHAT